MQVRGSALALKRSPFKKKSTLVPLSSMPKDSIQECIPVGCVPSATVAVVCGGGGAWSGGGVLLPGGPALGGACSGGGCLVPEGWCLLRGWYPSMH